MDHCRETCVRFLAAQCDAFEFLEFTKNILDQMAPFINLHVDIERLGASGMLRDNDFRLAFIHVFDDPVRIECLAGDQATKFNVVDLRRHAGGVKAMTGQQDEPHQIPKSAGQGQDFGGPAAL